MPQIRTKWHKLLSLIEQDEVYLTAPKEGKAVHWSEHNANKAGVKWLLQQFGELPKFVVDSELLEMVMDEGYAKSLLDMKKADVLRAPFPAMILEFDYMRRHYIVMFRDKADIDTHKYPWEDKEQNQQNAAGGLPFYGVVFQIQSDEHGDYLVMSPSIVGVSIEDRNGEPWIGFNAEGSLLFDASPALNELIKNTYVKDGGALYRAIATAMLVMHTGGVKHEVIDCTRINKKRKMSNKPAIPSHVYLSIGHVYRSDNSDKADDYVPRKSPRPHWRRGHIRTVHHGANRASVKQVYINPKLVAFKELKGEPPPTQKEYHLRK